MRNWTLTPAVILSLGSAWAGLVQADERATSDASHHSAQQAIHQRHPAAINLAGTVMAAHQIGPIRQHDLEARFALSHLSGPRPERLLAWMGDHSDRDRAQDIRLLSGRALVSLPLPPASHLTRTHLWVEVGDQPEGTARAAFHLKELGNEELTGS